MTLWTDEQEQIFSAVPSKNSLFIQAYAGCGKTTTITEFVSRHKETSALAFSFGKKTTAELRAALPSWVEVKTANSVGHKAWSSTIGKYNLEVDPDKLFKLLSKQNLQEEDWHIVRQLVLRARHAGLVPDSAQAVKLVKDTQENWESLTNLDPTEYHIDVARSILKESITLSYQGVIDFDDQIYMSSLFGGVFKRYGLVLVDEAQDLSTLNIRQVRRMANDRLVVVGDEHQSIYAFRGADANSMRNLRNLREPSEWVDFTLSESFRCPKAVVRRRNVYLPKFRASEKNPEGQIKEFKSTWFWKDIPKTKTIAILCRNNAPLVSMTFKLIRAGIDFSILGQENTRPLVSLARKILPKEGTSEEFIQSIHSWKEVEMLDAQTKNKTSKMEQITDKAESLLAFVSAVRPTELKQVTDAIKESMAKEKDSTSNITLSSVHRAKGLEFDTVIHLDPFRVPSIFATTSEERQQEMNILNVVETRTKLNLILANINHFQVE